MVDFSVDLREFENDAVTLDKSVELRSSIPADNADHSQDPDDLSFFNRDGSTNENFNQYLSSETAEREGVVSPEADGLVKEFGQGAKQGFVRAARGFSKTLGNERAVENLDYWLQNNNQLNKPITNGYFDPNNVGYVSGSAFADSSVSILTGAALGAIAATTGGAALLPALGIFSATFARSFGETREQILAENASMDGSEALGLAILETSITSAIEVGFGIEAIAAKSLAKGFAIQSLKRAGSKELLSRLGSSAWRFGKGLKGWTVSAAGEGTEEVAQRLTHEMIRNISSGEHYSDLDVYIDDFMNGTIGGAFLGTITGIQEIRNRSALNNLQRQLTQKAVESVHTVQSGEQSFFDKASFEKTEGAFAVFSESLVNSGRFNEETAVAITQVIRTASYNLALETGATPESFIESFNVVFADEDLSESDINTLRSLKNDQQKTFEFLDRKLNIKAKMQEKLDVNDTKELKDINDLKEIEASTLSIEDKQELKTAFDAALQRHIADIDQRIADASDDIQATVERTQARTGLEDLEEGDNQVTLSSAEQKPITRASIENKEEGEKQGQRLSEKGTSLAGIDRILTSIREASKRKDTAAAANKIRNAPQNQANINDPFISLLLNELESLDKNSDVGLKKSVAVAQRAEDAQKIIFESRNRLTTEQADSDLSLEEAEFERGKTTLSDSAEAELANLQRERASGVTELEIRLSDAQKTDLWASPIELSDGSLARFDIRTGKTTVISPKVILTGEREGDLRTTVISPEVILTGEREGDLRTSVELQQEQLAGEAVKQEQRTVTEADESTIITAADERRQAQIAKAQEHARNIKLEVAKQRKTEAEYKLDRVSVPTEQQILDEESKAQREKAGVNFDEIAPDFSATQRQKTIAKRMEIARKAKARIGNERKDADKDKREQQEAQAERALRDAIIRRETGDDTVVLFQEDGNLDVEVATQGIINNVNRYIAERRDSLDDTTLRSLENDAFAIRQMMGQANLSMIWDNVYDLRSRLARFGMLEAFQGLLDATRQPSLFAPGIKGQYLSVYNTAVFYSKADAGTIIHEWMHHITTQGLMSDASKRILKFHFNNGESMWSTEGLEKTANSVIEFLRDNVIDPSAPLEVTTAFDELKKIFAKNYANVNIISDAEGVEINEGARKFFDKVFSGIDLTDELSTVYGDALTDSMELGASGNAQALFQDETGNIPNRGQLNRQLHSAFKSHETLRQAAFKLYGKGTTLEEFSLKDLTTQQMYEMTQQLDFVVTETEQQKINITTFVLSTMGETSVKNLTDEQQILFESRVNDLERLANNEFDDEFNEQETLDELTTFMQAMPVVESTRAKAGKGPVVWQKFKANMRKISGSMNKYFMSPARIFYYLDGMDYNGPFSRTIGRTITAGNKKTQALNNADGTALVNLVKKNGGSFENMEKDVSLGSDERLFTTGEALSIHMMARNKAQKKALLESNLDVTQSVISSANKLVNDSSELQGTVKAIDQFYEKKYNDVNPTYVTLNGKALRKVGNYVPIQRENSAYADFDPVNELITGEINASRPAHAKQVESWQKERGQGKGSKIAINDPMTQAISYANSVNNFIGKAPNTRKLFKMIDKKGFLDGMKSAYGEDMEMWGMIDKFLKRELTPTGRDKPLTGVEIAARRLRTNTTVGLLGYRLTTLPRQAVSLFNALSIIPGAVSSLGNAISYGSGIASTMTGNLIAHERGSAHLLEGHRVLELWRKYSPEQIARHGGEPEIQEASSRGAQTLLSKVKIGGKSVFERSLEGIKSFDTWTVATAWLTAFDAKRLEFLGKNMSENSAEKAAAQFADSVIERTQPQSLLHQRALAQTENELFKGFIPFSSQLINNYQEYMTGVVAPLAKAMKTGDTSKFIEVLTSQSSPGDTSIAQKAVYASVIPAILIGLIARRRLPDEDEFIADILLYPVMSFPILGPAVTQGIMSRYGEPGFTPIYLDFAKNFISIVKDVAKDDVDLRGKTGREALRLFAELNALPEIVFQVGREMTDAMLRGEDLASLDADDILKIVQARIAESNPE